MTASTDLYSLLFEVSNEIRYGILQLLNSNPLRLTDITKELNLNNPEARRHISRLRDVKLIDRNIEGHYHLTPYGETVLVFLDEFNFLSSRKKYLQTHTLSGLPTSFVKRIGDLSNSSRIENVVDFFRHIDNLLKTSKECIWMLVDQFPLNSLSTIVKTIDRGVKLKVIEPRDSILKPDLDALTIEESQAITRTKSTPLVEQRVVEDVSVYLCLSENQCIVAFPYINSQYDYRGFTSSDATAIKWCQELFLHYWNEAESLTHLSPITQSERRIVDNDQSRYPAKILLEGTDNAQFDAQAVQDAVDFYDEVLLKGTFNFSTSTVQISRSVKMKGIGEEGGVPSTVIYKKGWRFPFTDFSSVFKIDAEEAEVTIENIHFTDFNHTCIFGIQCDRLIVKNNRITLMTGYGRGMSYGAFGEVVIGVWIRGSDSGGFKGEVLIEENHIDFARGGAFGGFLTRGGIEEDPEYRPDLLHHEYYMGFGIAVHQASGNVNIINNNIRNMNARGIAATDNYPSADVQIRNNTVESDLYGSYPFSSPEAGTGILVQSSWGFLSPGFNVEIEDNIINLRKLNHCGIKTLGAVIDREGTGKLKGGLIRNNQIILTNGYEGIHVRRCDDFEVSNNTLSGDAYYGIRISGREGSEKIDMISCRNLVENNNMDELRIREPDLYRKNNADGNMFPKNSGINFKPYVWLGTFTRKNVIKVRKNEKILDEGEDNKIEYS